MAGVLVLSNHLGVDLADYDLDQPVQKFKDIQGSQGLYSVAQKLSQEENFTLRDLGNAYGRGILVPQIVGTPSQIADQLEALFREEAGDGFVISPAFLPGAFDEFVDAVIPELQRRGLFRLDYTGNTLRDNLKH
jgi:alkanesulfonate monooxygenase SsuD/methylene tetrahydromethanopterin reductase-like flavin-dependent oxidoreductase (luciferase family)